jgi:hypothetical protein
MNSHMNQVKFETAQTSSRNTTSASPTWFIASTDDEMAGDSCR